MALITEMGLSLYTELMGPTRIVEECSEVLTEIRKLRTEIDTKDAQARLFNLVEDVMNCQFDVLESVKYFAQHYLREIEQIKETVTIAIGFGEFVASLIDNYDRCYQAVARVIKDDENEISGDMRKLKEFYLKINSSIEMHEEFTTCLKRIWEFYNARITRLQKTETRVRLQFESLDNMLKQFSSDVLEYEELD